MKIVAVIPARAGSRGIPNKNIRLIGGRPLISYAIRNAKASEYITDIVVSTDSPEVRMIAKQMGVQVHWRDESLCGDAVTLDAVIADAVPKGTDWDYVVTMQPTSPTLHVETLDAAIRYAMEKDLDTVLAAINAPRLSWSIRDGKKVPDYKERLNRQYMPPNYAETGAFVISRASVVTPQTRIGPKMDVFEIPENESQDVDNFQDLLSVSATLNQRSIGIFTDRAEDALELADEFFVKPDICYDPEVTDPKSFGDSKHNLFPVNGEELLQVCREKQYGMVIIMAAAGKQAVTALREAMPEAKIVCLGGGDGADAADLALDAVWDEQYYICPKTYLFFDPIPIREKVRDVIICTDGFEEILRKPEYAGIHFTAVPEGSKDLPELLAGCDLAVVSEGRTERNAAVLGIPTVLIREGAEETDPESVLLRGLQLTWKERKMLQEQQLRRCLRDGRKRVLNLINSL